MPSEPNLEKHLIDVKSVIWENPNSKLAMRLVEDKLKEVAVQTTRFQRYSVSDFLRLVEFNVLAVGYARRGLNDLVLLSTLAGTLPKSLDASILFPVVQPNGKRRLWYYSDAADHTSKLSATYSRTAAYSVMRSFGEYSLFISGVFPDIFSRVEKKGGVNVAYYESNGSTALLSASRGPAVVDSPFSNALAELARNFSDYRKLLNEAAFIIGAPAREMVVRNLLEQFGVVLVRGNAAVGQRKKALEQRQALARPDDVAGHYGFSLN